MLFFWEDLDRWFGNGYGDDRPTYIQLQPGIVENNHIICGVSYCNRSVRRNNYPFEDYTNLKGRSRIYDITWNSHSQNWVGNNTTNFANDNNWDLKSDDNAIFCSNSYTRDFNEGNIPCIRTATDISIVRNLACSQNYFVLKFFRHFDDASNMGICEPGDDWIDMNTFFGGTFNGERWSLSTIGEIGDVGAPCGNLFCMHRNYIQNLIPTPNYLAFSVSTAVGKSDNTVSYDEFASRSYVSTFIPKMLSFSGLKMIQQKYASNEIWYDPFKKGLCVLGKDFLGLSEQMFNGLCEPPATQDKTNGLLFPIYDPIKKDWFFNYSVGDEVAEYEPSYYLETTDKKTNYKMSGGNSFFVYANGSISSNSRVGVIQRINDGSSSYGYSQPRTNASSLYGYIASEIDTIIAAENSFVVVTNHNTFDLYRVDSLSLSFQGCPVECPVSQVKIIDGNKNEYKLKYMFENGIYSKQLDEVMYAKVSITDPLNNVTVKKYITSETKLSGLNTETGYTYIADDLPYLLGVNYRNYSTRTGSAKIYSSEENLYRRMNLNGSYPLAGSDALKEKLTKLFASKAAVDGVTKRWEYGYEQQYGNENKRLFKNGTKSLLEYTEYANTVTAYQNSNIASFPFLQAAYAVNEATYAINDVPNLVDIKNAIVTTYITNSPKRVWEQWFWNVPIAQNEMPTKVFSPFNLAVGPTNPDWQRKVAIDKYNSASGILQTSNALGISSTTIYSNDNVLPIASVANAKYGECLFTNFTENNIGVAVRATASMTSATGEHLFSGRAAKISGFQVTTDQYARSPLTPDNADIPALDSRTFVIDFWAKSSLPSTTSFIHLQSESDRWSTAPLFAVTNIWKKFSVTCTFPDNVTDKKYRVVLRPPATGPGNFTGGTIFYDDVRVYPKTSLMTTTYYSPILRQPVVSIDANNNPGQLVTYDGFGRPIEWRKIDKTDPLVTKLVQKKEYHLNVPNTAPPAPTGLSAAQQRPDNTVKFNWTGVADPDGDPVKYSVYVVGKGIIGSNITGTSYSKDFVFEEIPSTTTPQGWYVVAEDGTHQTNSAMGTFVFMFVSF